MKRVMIFGPTSWDTAVNVREYPQNGGFAQGLRRDERAGGAGMNIAAAISSANITTSFFSYVGSDEIGRNLRDHLESLSISNLVVDTLEGASLHAVIIIDDEGERTIIALEPNRFAELNYQVDFHSEDIVVFPVWRDFYNQYLQLANQKAAFTVVGLGAVHDFDVKANLIIGSEKDVSNFEFDSTRFGTAIITMGSSGIKWINSNESKVISARIVEVEDATGAGDSFLSGVIVGLARGKPMRVALEIGMNWAKTAVQVKGSCPPKWDDSFDVS